MVASLENKIWRIRCRLVVKTKNEGKTVAEIKKHMYYEEGNGCWWMRGAK